jgi:hypothetical protein
VTDKDPFTPGELVDVFAIDIEASDLPAGRGMSEAVTFPGIFGFANISLSFEVECLPGFVGETCVEISQICSTDPCSNNGTCLQSASGFTCTCVGDFTGETCETRINDCQDVDCNGGTCVDGVRSFTCQCVGGLTGRFCETSNTTCIGASGSSVSIGVVAGTFSAGAVLLLFLLVVISGFICIKVYSCGKRVLMKCFVSPIKQREDVLHNVLMHTYAPPH